jgi:hypothetical protein
MKKSLAISSLLILFSFNSLVAAEAAVKAGTTCPKVGKTSTANNRIYTCIKLGSKLYWNNGILIKSSTPSTQTKSPLSGTVSQQNAVKKAESYLRSSAFSRSGLISQLEFSGFSAAEATFGTDSQKADWNEQAALKAASYLRSSAFSRVSLIAQLEFSGFTKSEAEYGVSRVGL